MRNLKRALSLTLASVMLLGMMVVGTSAAGYDDVKKTDNVEAIEVLQTIEVMVGDERGFGPERPVNRAEMAVVMGKLLNLDYDYYATSCPFNDVYDWARGYVGACYANKIVSGRGEGVYDPGATVTAVEAASMLMRALGYFQYANDVADGFELSTVRQGTKIGIFDNVGSSATEPMTRNQVAQMVLNALRSGTVEPDGNTINLTTPDGSVFTGKVNYVFVTSQKSYAYAISNIGATSIGSQNSGAIVELGEKLYNGELKLTDHTIDDFGRPSRHWEFKGTDIGTYEKKELLRKEYTVEVTGKELHDLLTQSTLDRYGFTLTIDGETAQNVLNGNDAGDDFYFDAGNLIRTNIKGVGGTGKGVLTRVYVDTDVGYERIYVAIINTYLAKATDDYSETKEEAKFDLFGIEDIDESSTGIVLVKNTHDDDDDKPYTENLTVKNEDIEVKDVKNKDIFLAHVAKGEVKELIKPETVDSTTIRSFRNGSWVNAEGTQYDYDNTAVYDPEVLDEYDDVNMKDTTYRVFLDEYGYLIGLEIIEEPDQYVFLTGIDTDTSNLSARTAKGNVIHLDGTMETVTIDLEKSLKDNENDAAPAGQKWIAFTDGDLTALMNTWCRYTVSNSGVYTLTEIANTTDNYNTAKNKTGQGRNEVADPTDTTQREILTLDKSHITLDGIQKLGSGAADTASPMKRVYANDNTVYIVAQTKGINTKAPGRPCVVISGVESVTTGMRNVNLKAWNPAKVQAETEEGKTVAASAALTDVVYGAYTLFNDKGNVIAVVVVGEDDGTTSSYAFVHSDKMIQEDYADDADRWTWHRNVIINGEEVTLTEKGTSNPEIGNRGTKGGKMAQGEWFEIKYDANGNVRHVTQLGLYDTPSISMPDYDFNNYLPYNSTKYVADMNDVEKAVDANKNSIVLWQNLTDTEYKISSNGNTLHIDNKSDATITRGIDMSPDAKIVLLQDTIKSNNKGFTTMGDKFIGSWVGGSGAASAVKQLNGNLTGYVGAVFENGVATSVIIWDMEKTIINVGTSRPGGDDNNNQSKLGISEDASGNLIYRYYKSSFAPADWAQIREDAANAVADYLNADILRNNLPTAMTAATGGSRTGTGGEIRLDDGSLKGEGVQLTVQRMIKVTQDDVFVDYIEAKNSATTVKELTNGKYILGTDQKVANASEKTVSGNQLAITPAGVTDTDADVALTTAYQVTTGGKTVVLKSDNTVTVANTNWVKKGTVVTVTGDATVDNLFSQLYAEPTAGGAKVAVGAQSQVTAADKAAKGDFEVTYNVTFSETEGVEVRVNGEYVGIIGTAGGSTILFDGESTWSDDTEFAAAKTVATGGKHYTAKATGTVTPTRQGFQYAYSATDADVGKINLIPVAEVKTTADVTAEYSYGNSQTATIAASQTVYVASGTTLTIKEGTAANNMYITVDVDAAGSATKVTDSTTSNGTTPAQATFSIGVANFGHSYEFGKDDT